MNSEVIELLKKSEEIAMKKYNGHFSLMRLNFYNWKFCFGKHNKPTILVSGNSMEEAIKNAINFELLKQCEEIAKQKYDGHFTLMRFTTNWKFCFGQPYTYEEIQHMTTGKTMWEAIQKGIDKDCNAHSFYKEIREDG
ncbi:hypothetical protein TSYNTROOL_14310 [Tepidanaerobacter syntrophicus]|uniref:hypothetical protein n=1 Tax=Tepidanaerobacter syntrophicus TaxID=224999 RepID=UPI0022EE279D|nr:hypothetical protein [Tepidanaerobacter syntrophicus]GLI51345.1 hypothetical protein TSYNTROOL_14310 [Tepidanaerobacter syntrophicus]